MNWIKDLKNGENIIPYCEYYAYVISAEVKDSKAGKEYIDANISDGTGEVNCKVWSVNDSIKKALQAGNCILVEGGSVGSYQDKPQIKLTKVQLVDIEIGVSMNLFPQSDFSLENLLEAVDSFITEPYQQQIMDSFRNKFSTIWEKFISYPGAKAIHHAYIRGLLEHSVSVAQIAHNMGMALTEGGYQVNMPVVTLGALLHDIGKIQEFQVNNVGLCEDYSQGGALIGHLSLGTSMFSSIAADTETPKSAILGILHIIASHHDRPEWGAVKPPSTIEAMIVAKADMLDFEANVIRKEFKNTEEKKVKIFALNNKYIHNLHV